MKFNSTSADTLTPSTVQALILKKGVLPLLLAEKFCVNRHEIALAFSGKHPNLLLKIYAYVNAL